MDNSRFIKEHECPACGGSMVFDPEKGKLVCEYCGTEYEIKEEKKSEAPVEAPAEAEAETEAEAAAEAEAPKGPEIEGFDFTKFYESAELKTGDELPVYRCKSCGAEVIAAGEEASLTCPYCTNKIVLTDKMAGNIRPDGIIPFKIPKNELKAHLENFYKDKKLLPKDFFSSSKMDRVTGVYVPFWLFSGTLSGNFKFSCSNVSTKEENSYKVTTTKNYRVERAADVGFTDIPIDASDKLDDKLMDSVLPFDKEEIKDYSADYLAGYAADRFDVPGKQLQGRADGLMKRTVKGLVEASLAGQYTKVSPGSSSMNASDVKVRYVLFPVYVFSIKYGKKSFGFAVNGQSGKVVGQLPTDKKVSRMYFLTRFGIISAAIMAVSLISYFLGGAL